MAITTINTGSNPNDGSGDSIRAAFIKANENFTYLQSIIGNLALNGTSGLIVSGPVRITSTGAALLTGTFRIRPTSSDPYSDILTTASTFQGGEVPDVTNFTNDTESSSPTTGAVTISGGLGVAGTATMGAAIVQGNLSVNNVNLTAAGQFTLPDGSPFAFDVFANAALQATSLATLTANAALQEANLAIMVANASSQQSSLDTIRANIGAYQIYANANVGTLFLGNVSTNANLGAYQTYANSQSQTFDANLGTLFLGNISTNANLGAYQAWANLTLSTVANAVNQQDAIDGLVLGNLSVNANIGAYQTYANIQASTFDANLGTLYLGNIDINANLGAYQTYANVQAGTFDANLGTLFLGNVSTNANIGAFQQDTNANVGTLFLGNVSTNANIGAYQTWANATLAPLLSPAFTQTPTAPTAAAGTNSTQIATTGFVFEANTGLSANVSSNIGQLRYNLVSNYAPLTAPVFQSNLFTGSSANVFVANNSTATFSSNVEIGYFDGTPANLTVRHGTPSSFGGFAYFMSNLVAVGNIIASAPTTFVSNVDIGNANGVAANLTVRNGVSASIFAMGNITVWREYSPAAGTGAIGDFPGIIALDPNSISPGPPVVSVCTGHYDGSTVIWGNVALAAFV
jgi:hypothetical protein